MKKLKTRHAAKKRFHKTSNEKFMRRRPSKSHLLEKKNPKRKRNLSLVTLVSFSDIKPIHKMLPNA